MICVGLYHQLIHVRPNSEIKASNRSEGNTLPTDRHENPPSSTPAWAAWEVDRDSLCCINQWNREHQDNKFSTVVLSGVNRLLESQVFEATLAFIPDNPVPAKSLVKALVSLTLLVTVSKPCQIQLPFSASSLRKFPKQNKKFVTLRGRLQQTLAFLRMPLVLVTARS